MTRVGKKEERKNISPRKRRPNMAKKTGPKKDNLENGYKVHNNALNEDIAFIPKIK